jgi:formylglycine-generating enzyme required for sulfatase activity
MRPLLAILAALLLTAPAAGQPDPSGIDFVTIGSPDNPAWAGNGTPGDRAVGRGSVPYEYRIGRYEVTTSQFVEFFNAAFDRPVDDRLPHLIPPDFWGAASTTPTTPGGLRWTVPAGNEMIPVGNISWRMAAMYCNWLHNDKGSDRSAFLNGAYDVSTFSYTGSVFNDQWTRSPGARYFIPSWDEWLKAAHWSPTNPSNNGWHLYPNSSDTPLVYGPPGVLVNGQPTQANGAWDHLTFPGFNPFAIPLGAYPTVQSPWGLLDVAGGTTEWTEGISFTNEVFPTGRLFDGTSWASPSTQPRDRLGGRGADFPSLSTFDLGFRIAAAVPAPSATLPCLCVLGLAARRRA